MDSPFLQLIHYFSGGFLAFELVIPGRIAIPLVDSSSIIW
jgi:hypothetical protein